MPTGPGTYGSKRGRPKKSTKKRVVISDAPDKVVSIKIIKPKKRPALSKKERTEALDRALKKMADSGYKLDSSLDFLQKSKPKKFRR